MAKTIQIIKDEAIDTLNRLKDQTGLTEPEILEEAIYMYEAALHDGIYEVDGETFHTIEEFMKQEQDLKKVYEFVEMDRSDGLDVVFWHVIETGRAAGWDDNRMQDEFLKVAADVRDSENLTDEEIEAMIQEDDRLKREK